MRHVKLIYFKKSGKYYSEGKYTSEKDLDFELFAEVGQMLENGRLPDLVDGAKEFIVLVLVDNGVPALIME